MDENNVEDISVKLLDFYRNVVKVIEIATMETGQIKYKNESYVECVIYRHMIWNDKECINSVFRRIAESD